MMRFWNIALAASIFVPISIVVVTVWKWTVIYYAQHPIQTGVDWMIIWTATLAVVALLTFLGGVASVIVLIKAASYAYKQVEVIRETSKVQLTNQVLNSDWLLNAAKSLGALLREVSAQHQTAKDNVRRMVDGTLPPVEVAKYQACYEATVGPMNYLGILYKRGAPRQ